MNLWIKQLSILSAMSLAACSAVFAPEPMGDTVNSLNPEEWQATWLSDEVVVVTTVLDADKGLIETAWIERSMTGARLETAEAQIRSSGDVLFASSKEENDQSGTRYVWIRIDKTHNRLTVFRPNVEKFQSLIETGDFPGKVIEDGVILGALTPEHIQVINSPSSHLLDWEEPEVFIRIAD